MLIRSTCLIFGILVLAMSACGDDDGQPSSSASSTATASPSQGGPFITASPGRPLPAADHVGLNVINPLTFFEQELQGADPTVVFCAGVDLQSGVIDCVEAGYGTIAVDPIPQVASGELLCRVMLKPTGELFAASCAGELPSGPGAYIYGIQS